MATKREEATRRDGAEASPSASCGSHQGDKEEDRHLRERMDRIRHKILVLSGKGGVGKSTVAVNLAVALGMEGNRVGLLDVDFHGPSIPTLLNLSGRTLKVDGEAIHPLELGAGGIKVVSLGLILSDQNEAVIWRGPMKIKVIRQLLQEVDWGDLDYLVIDFPPGTGDEPLSVAQMLPESDGAIIVTTPQTLSTVDVRKSIRFCGHLNVPVLGVLENMSGMVCPHCGREIQPFKTGGGESLARELGVPFLGRIPLDPQIMEASDQGRPFAYFHAQIPAAETLRRIVQLVLALDDTQGGKETP